jgi:hypothetical protein
MHSIEKNGPNAGCVEVRQVPLITPEEFAGMGRGIERHFTVAMSHYTPPVPKCLQYSQKLASFFLTQIFLGKGTVRLMVTVFDHCRCCYSCLMLQLLLIMPTGPHPAFPSFPSIH